MAKRQKALPGMEPVAIPEVDAAAEAYVQQRDKRMRMSVKEKDAKNALIAAMAKHELSIYRDDGANLVVTVSEGSPNVKVEEAKPEPKDDDADEDGGSEKDD